MSDTTTTTTRAAGAPVAVLGYAPCGHAVFAGILDSAHVEEQIASGRQRGLEFALVEELPGLGALQPSCPRCQAKRRKER